MTAIALRPYQSEAIRAVADAYRDGTRRPLISLPTGTGKTIVLAHITAGAVAKGRRVLILAHRDELLTQAADKLCRVAPDLAMSVGRVKGGENDVYSQVVVASVQTLARQRRLDAYLEAGGADVVIVDEAHHAAADSYQRVLDGLGCLEDGTSMLTLGVTATPQRADARDLGATWEQVVYHRDLLGMIRDGYLCDLRGYQVRLESFHAEDLSVSRGEFRADESGEALEAAEAPRYAVEAWREHAAGRRTIVFTPTIALAQAMASAFREAGIAAESASGEMTTDDRRATLARFANGSTTVVANAMLLTEGFDEPAVSCIIVARPTRSQPLYVQMVGRGTRIHPGKTDCVILDLVGATDRMDLTTLPLLFGLGEDADTGDPAEPVEDGILAATARREELQVRQGRLVAREVALFNRRDLAWAQTPDGGRVLAVGDETIMVERANGGDSYSVRVLPRVGAPRLLASALDLGYAIGTAEDYARSAPGFAATLVDRNAAWRGRDASAAQLETLRKLRVSVPVGCSAGEASTLITAAIATRRARRAERSA